MFWSTDPGISATKHPKILSVWSKCTVKCTTFFGQQVLILFSLSQDVNKTREFPLLLPLWDLCGLLSHLKLGHIPTLIYICKLHVTLQHSAHQRGRVDILPIAGSGYNCSLYPFSLMNHHYYFWTTLTPPVSTHWS